MLVYDLQSQFPRPLILRQFRTDNFNPGVVRKITNSKVGNVFVIFVLIICSSSVCRTQVRLLQIIKKQKTFAFAFYVVENKKEKTKKG